MVLVHVNIENVHWELLAIDIKSKIAYFDNGLMWASLSISYVHLIPRELNTKFPDCDKFFFRDWLVVKTFNHFGMLRKQTDGKIILIKSWGTRVILSAQDFISSH